MLWPQGDFVSRRWSRARGAPSSTVFTTAAPVGSKLVFFSAQAIFLMVADTRFAVIQHVEDLDAADGEVKAPVHPDAHVNESDSASNAPDKDPAAGEQAGAPPNA